MVRAQHIYQELKNKSIRYVAVFKHTTRYTSVVELMNQFEKTPEVQKINVALEFCSPPVLHILMDVATNNNTVAIVRRFKSLVNPELSFTISHIRQTLYVCTCDKVKSELNIRFAIGLEPEDDELFNLQLAAKLKQRQIGGPISAAIAGNYEGLRQVFIGICRELNTFIQDYTIELLSGPAPCPHV